MTVIDHRRIRAADADVIVIGAGLNGLICGALLAQARLRVLILEARQRPGGFCATAEIIPGFRVPIFTPWTGPLDAAVVKTLKLQKFGLDVSPQRLSTIALSPDGHHLVLDPHARRGSGALTQHSAADAKAFPAFDTAMRKLAAGLGAFVSEPPVRAAAKQNLVARLRPDDTVRAGLSGLAIRPISSLLEEYLDSPLLQGALALDAVIGTGLGPHSPGSALAWIERLAMETVRPDTAVWFQGGPGPLTSALSEAAQSVGVSLRVNARVSTLIADHGRVEGVVLNNGEAVYAPVVVSSLPQDHVLNWPDVRRATPPGFERFVADSDGPHGVAKIHLALRGTPQFKGLDMRDLRARYLVAGDLATVGQAYDSAVRGQIADTPPLEVVLPSAMDSSLAPREGQVLSVTFPFAPLVPAGGWAAAKGKLTLSTIETLGRFAPDLPNRVLAAEVETPDTLAQVGQSLLWRRVRPAVGFGQNPYGSPIEGLFFCGAGTHPRAGATGLNGRNCADAILAFSPVGREPT